MKQGIRAMNRFQTIEELQGHIRVAKAEGKKVGFVPTMGALHPGHASLIELAEKASDEVVVSIFVNPTQFNSRADFETYPLTVKDDMDVARRAGATSVFTPTVDELYGGDLAVGTVDYGRLTSAYEGQKRRGHFDGVVAVVRKLFSAVDADRAFFGEKDLQQLAVIRRLAQEEFKGLEIVGCPLIRERDGLAMSSRNIRLGDRSRQEALALHDWLNRVKDVACTQGDIKATLHAIESEASSLKAIDLEYIDVVDAMTFEPLRNQSAEKKAHAIVAANVGGVRLIDNCALACS